MSKTEGTQSNNVVEKNRLVYFDPNEFPSWNYTYDGDKVSNTTWNQEDLKMDIDLQVIVPSNDDCGTINYHIQSDQWVKELNRNSFGEWVSFMQGDLQHGDNNYQTTNYTNISFSEIKENRVVSKESLGIKNIDINFDAHFYPLVTIKFTDIRGYSLFSPSEYSFDTEAGGQPIGQLSFFYSLFRFPYPRFLLSVKGFYGNRITFTLAVQDFKAAFNSESGDFDVTVKFIGYIYGALVDLPMDLIIASPYYNREYWENEKANGNFTYNDNGKNGNPILTYVEFNDKMENLGENISSEAVASNTTVQKYNEIKNKLSDLSTIEKAYDETFNAIEYQNGCQSIVVTGQTYDIVFYKGDSFSIEDKFTKEINKYFDTYTEEKDIYNKNMTLSGDETKVSNFILSDIRTPDGQTSGEYIKKHVQHTFYVFVFEDSHIKSYTNSTFEKFFDSFITKTTVNYSGTEVSGMGDCFYNKDTKKLEKEPYYEHFIVLKKTPFYDYIKDRKQDLTNKKNGIEKELSDAIMPIYSNAIGFKPTIENTYRMLFAHIDCFMNYFYNILSEVSNHRLDNTRNPKELGLTKDNSDIKNFKNTWVGPFPSYYENKNNTKHQQYPGKAQEKVSEIIEVEKVNNIIDSITTVAEEIGTALNSTSGTIHGNMLTLLDIITDGNKIWDNFAVSNTDPYKDAVNAIYTIIVKYCMELAFGEFYNEDPANSITQTTELWIQKQVEQFKNDVGNNIKNKGNFISSVKTIQKAGDDEFIKTLNHLYGSGKDNGKLIYDYIYDTSDQLPQYFNTIFDKNSIKDIPKVVSLDELSISGYNGILSGHTSTSCYGLYKQLSENEISQCDEWHRTENFANAYSFLFYKESFDKNKQIQAPNEEFVYKTLTYILRDKKAPDCFIPFIATSYHNDDGYDPINIFSKNEYGEYNCDIILKNFCKNDYCLFWYYALTRFSSENLIIQSIYKKLKNSLTGIYEIDKLSLLIFGGFCYRYINNIEYNTLDKENIKDAKALSFLKNLLAVDKPRWFIVNNDEMSYVFKNNNLGDINDLNNSTIYKICAEYFVDWVQNIGISLFDKLKTTEENSRLKYYRRFYGKEITIEAYYSDYEGCEELVDLYCNVEYVVLYRKPTKLKFPWVNQKAFNEICTTLYSVFDEEKDTENTSTNETQSDVEFNTDAYTKLYYILKCLCMKWLSGYTKRDWKLESPEKCVQRRKERFELSSVKKSDNYSEFDSFLYIDQFYNDISNSFIIDTNTISQVIGRYKVGKLETSVYEFMQDIAQSNELQLIALPVFNNFYNKNSAVEVFTPNTIYNSENNDGRGFGNTYILLYGNKASEQSDFSNDNSYNFTRDYPDIGDVVHSNAVDLEDLKLFDESKDGSQIYKLFAFAVTFSKQNQMYFKNIQVGMDTPKATSESLANLIMIAKAGENADLSNPVAIGQNFFSVYANRSYTCTIEMMGCMNIMPLMYFQLNNIPMFRGMYMVVNVSHQISEGNFVTRFTGVRVSKYLAPRLDVCLLNKNLMDIINGTFSNSEGGSSYYTSMGMKNNPSNKPSHSMNKSWKKTIETMGDWYEKHIHSYRRGPSASKHATNRGYYDCNLIGTSVGDDCSSFVKACLQGFGIGEDLDKIWLTTTSMQPTYDEKNNKNFNTLLDENGFTRIDYDKNSTQLKCGDIVCTGAEGHTEIYYGTKSNGDTLWYGWGNVHDGKTPNAGMPFTRTKANFAKQNYKHIWRRENIDTPLNSVDES